MEFEDICLNSTINKFYVKSPKNADFLSLCDTVRCAVRINSFVYNRDRVKYV